MSHPKSHLPILSFERRGQRYTISLPPIENWITQNGKYCFTDAVFSQTQVPVWVKECSASNSQKRLIENLMAAHCEFVPAVLCSASSADKFYYATVRLNAEVCQDGLKEQAFFFRLLSGPKTLCEIIKAWMTLLRCVNDLGFYYRDVTLKNLLLDLQNVKVWIIDLDSCSVLRETVKSGGSFCEEYSILLPLKVFPKKKSALANGTLLGSQVAAIGMAFAIVRAYGKVKIGDFKTARNLLTKALSTDDNSNLLANCVAQASQVELQEYLSLNTDAKQLHNEISIWRSKAQFGTKGDWDACFRVINALTEAAFGLSVHSKEHLAVQEWVKLFAQIEKGRDPFNVLNQWPEGLDPTQFGDLQFAGHPVPELVQQLRQSLKSMQSLTSLVSHWKSEADLEAKLKIANHICGAEGRELAATLHDSHATTSQLRDRCFVIAKWRDALDEVNSAISKANQLEQIGELSSALDILDEFFPRWTQYRPLVKTYRRICGSMVPWDEVDLREKIDTARSERRYQQVITDLSLLISGRMTNRLNREATTALDQAQSFVVEGRKQMARGNPSEAVKAFSSALEYATDCHEARVGLASASVAERNLQLSHVSNDARKQAKTWFWRSK